MHYYGWISGYSTSQSTVANTLSNIVSDAQKLTSADGTVPVLIGGYGNGTTGVAIDANGAQVVAAVLQSGLGSAAWAGAAVARVTVCPTAALACPISGGRSPPALLPLPLRGRRCRCRWQAWHPRRQARPRRTIQP